MKQQITRRQVRLASVMIITPDCDTIAGMSTSFLTALAQARPDPGGGAAAAYGARLGLALLEKVVRLELQRPQHNAPRTRRWENILEQGQRVAAALSQLQEKDVRAYFHLTRARASGKPEELRAAVKEAVSCPRQIMEQAHAGLTLVSETGAQCQKHLLSDLLVACQLLLAALQGAYHIAGANLPLMTEVAPRRALVMELEQASQSGLALWIKVHEELLLRGHSIDRRRG